MMSGKGKQEVEIREKKTLKVEGVRKGESRKKGSGEAPLPPVGMAKAEKKNGEEEKCSLYDETAPCSREGRRRPKGVVME